MKATTPAYSTPAVLGYAGLIPFVVLCVTCVSSGGLGAPWNHALVSYGAVIVSFVGALHWGFAMALKDLPETRRRRMMIWSVMPGLLGWTALLLAPPAANLLLICGFAAHYVQDRSLQRLGVLPAWFLPLRLRLTLVACACLGIAGLFVRYALTARL